DRQLRLQRAGDPHCDLVLHGKEIADIAIEPIGPELGVGLGIDKHGVDADLGAGAAHAPLHDVAYPQFAADFFGVGDLALVGEGAVTGDDDDAGNAGNIDRQVLGDAVGEIFLFR